MGSCSERQRQSLYLAQIQGCCAESRGRFRLQGRWGAEQWSSSNPCLGRRALPSPPWLRLSSGVSTNLIKKGIVKSSSDSGCEIMLLNPNNFYSNQLPRHEELPAEVEAWGGDHVDTFLWIPNPALGRTSIKKKIHFISIQSVLKSILWNIKAHVSKYYRTGKYPRVIRRIKKNQNSCRNFGDDFKKTCNRMMDFCTQKSL